MDLTKSYRDTSATGPSGTANCNTAAAANTIACYQCPSNPFKLNDPELRWPGLFCTVYTDIDATTGIRNTGDCLRQHHEVESRSSAPTVNVGPNTTDARNLTSGDPTTAAAKSLATNVKVGTSPTNVGIAEIRDGTTTTIAVIEMLAAAAPKALLRTTRCRPTARPPRTLVRPTSPTRGCGSTVRGVWRWADPDAGGSGISGPPDAAVGSSGVYEGKVINQHGSPIGGVGTTGNYLRTLDAS